MADDQPLVRMAVVGTRRRVARRRSGDPEAHAHYAEPDPRWKNHFRVLPYVADDAPLGDVDSSDADDAALALTDSGRDDALAEDDTTDRDVTGARVDAAVGDGASLADWFGTCCKLSDAERLRWFLREAQLYCQHHFGDSTMTDTEARYIREYLDLTRTRDTCMPRSPWRARGLPSSTMRADGSWST